MRRSGIGWQRVLLLGLLAGACGSDPPQAQQAEATATHTIARPATHTTTPLTTASHTPAVTASPTTTPSATASPTSTVTPTWTPTPPGTPTATSTATATLSPTLTPKIVLSFDAYRGWHGVTAPATGRFRIAQVDGVWWLITPEGHGFFSAGVNSVRPEGDFAPALNRSPYHETVLAKYGSEAAWADAVIARFDTLRLTTIGAWSRYELFAGRVPYTVILAFADRAPIVAAVRPGLTGKFMRDIFAVAFMEGAAAEAEAARGCAADAYCVGAFTDNELGWGPGVVHPVHHLDGYMTLPAGAAGKRALQAFFERRYADVAAFNAAWDQQLISFDDLQMLSRLPRSLADPPHRDADRQAFTADVARQYFSVVHDALRAAAPEVLILGARFVAYSSSAALIEAAAPYVDVMSINQYEVSESARMLAADAARRYGYVFTGDLFADLDVIHGLAQRPLLLSEFSYRAADAGLPNTFPPQFPTLATQAERAEAYARYMRRALSRPFVVGAHWFGYADQPASGRFDGENNNWGIVNIDDQEYAELAAQMGLANTLVYHRPLPEPPAAE